MKLWKTTDDFCIAATIPPEQWNLDRPTILRLPGSHATDDDPKKMLDAEYKLFLESFPGISKEKDQLIGVSSASASADMNAFTTLLAHYKKPENLDITYLSYHSIKDNIENIKKYNTDPTFCSDEVREIFNTLLLPQLVDVSGKKKDVSEIRKRLSNLTLLANSYGSIVAHELENAMSTKMHELGFREPEIQSCLSSIACIITGNIAKIPDNKQKSFRKYVFEGVNDKVADLRNPGRQTYDLEEGQLKIKRLPNDGMHIYVRVPERVKRIHFKPMPGGAYAPPKEQHDDTAHVLANYIHPSLSLHGFSIPEMLRNVLINCTGRAETSVNRLNMSCSRIFYPNSAPIDYSLPTERTYTQEVVRHALSEMSRGI